MKLLEIALLDANTSIETFMELVDSQKKVSGNTNVLIWLVSRQFEIDEEYTFIGTLGNVIPIYRYSLELQLAKLSAALV